MKKERARRVIQEEKNMIKTVSLLILVFTITLSAQKSKDPVISEFTKKTEQQKFLEDLRNRVIKENFSLPLSKSTEEKWEQAFWAVQLILDKSDSTLSKVKFALSTFPVRGAGFIRSALQAAYTLFPDTLSTEVRAIFDSTLNTKLFTMAALYLLRSGKTDYNSISEMVNSRFIKEKDDPILTMLLWQTGEQQDIPPVEEILKYQPDSTKITIYSLQRKNRNYDGKLIIKLPGNKLYRNPDSSLFIIPQFARAVSNLPGYLTNGNSPQGVYSINVPYVSENKFIGPTKRLKLFLPFEVKQNIFFHYSIKSNADITGEQYAALLPESWRGFTGIYESFYAGKAGRYDIVIHGATTDRSYYEKEVYYPNIPTNGCLSTLEYWDPVTGKRTESDQQKLIDFIEKSGNPPGFLVLVEIDDQQQDVTYEEVMELINLAGLE